MKRLKLHRNAALIEAADPLVLTEITSDPALQPFLGEKLSDTCVVVQPQAAPEVVQRLRALGHMPCVDEPEGRVGETDSQ